MSSGLKHHGTSMLHARLSAVRKSVPLASLSSEQQRSSRYEQPSRPCCSFHVIFWRVLLPLVTFCAAFDLYRRDMLRHTWIHEPKESDSVIFGRNSTVFSTIKHDSLRDTLYFTVVTGQIEHVVPTETHDPCVPVVCPLSFSLSLSPSYDGGLWRLQSNE